MSRKRTQSDPATETAVEADAPLEVTMQTPDTSSLKDAPSKEAIEAEISSKLSKRDDSEGVNPFVPLTQVTKEVKQVAESAGFPLSRGTEIGARLIARAQRANN
jgi:hypothetical protein